MANGIVEAPARPMLGSLRFAVMLGIIESAESGEPVRISVPGTTLPCSFRRRVKRLLFKPLLAQPSSPKSERPGSKRE
jgi:hypothetical protein